MTFNTLLTIFVLGVVRAIEPSNGKIYLSTPELDQNGVPPNESSVCIPFTPIEQGDPEKRFWIIRVNDGANFRNSKFPFWGVKRGKGGCIKTIVKKMNKGDILWFMTSKKYGGKLIGMSEYCKFCDRHDEPLIRIDTLTNEQQNWKGDEDWDIQIHYCNLYVTEKQNITGCIQCGGVILEYETFKDKINGNLYNHYKNFKFYAEPK